MCFTGCMILTGVNQGDMSRPAPPNLGTSIAKRMFDMAILFAVGDLNQAKKLFAKNTVTTTEPVAATVTANNEPFDHDHQPGHVVINIPDEEPLNTARSDGAAQNDERLVVENFRAERPVRPERAGRAEAVVSPELSASPGIAPRLR